jgi:8-oxo-dGTP diphosphatase
MTSWAPDVVAVTVDLVILTVRDDHLVVLVAERQWDPFRGSLALPGGFVEQSESLEYAARRVLAQKAGLNDPGHLEQLRTYGEPERDSRMRVISTAYLSLVPQLPEVANLARWVPVRALGGGGLAFDHDRILADGVERARAKLEYTSLAGAFCQEPFTLGELRRIYETVWGVALNVPNFRRKVLSTPGLVEAIGQRTEPGSGGRPAQLYRRGGAGLLHPAMLRPESA